MKDRIKAVRLAQRNENGKKLTQSEFAKELGLARSTIACFEIGDRYPADSVINLICMQYGINKDWLLTGEGEMETPKSHEEEIAEISAKLFNEKDPLRKELLSLISDMGQDELDAVAKLRTYIDKKTKK